VPVYRCLFFKENTKARYFWQPICFACAFLISSCAQAQLESETQCLIGEPASHRFAVSSIAGVPANFKPKRYRYTKRIQRSNVVIDVRNLFGQKQQARVSIDGALSIPLHEIKAKLYLKDKKLVLVGDGLDDYFLEKEIDELELRGFASVKLLEYGISALIGTQRLSGDVTTSFALKVASAEKLLGGAMGSGETQNFVFINLGELNSYYADLQLRYFNLPFDNNDQFYQELYQYVETEAKKNSNLRLVLVHDDPAVYTQITRSPEMFDMLGLWFMQGGNTALAGLNQKVKNTLIASQVVQNSCAR